MTDDKLADVLTSPEKLEDYLLKKARGHNYFKIYTSLDRVEYMLREQALFLSNGTTWNDVQDRESFNTVDSAYTNFGCCFSFSKSENMAMWMLYGGIHKKGAMLKIPPALLRRMIDCRGVIEAGFFENGHFVPKFTLTKDQYTIKLIDVVYYSVETAGYTIKRSDERCFVESIHILDYLGCCRKRYPWSYENECRLIISVKNEFLKDSRINQIRFPIAEEQIDALTEDQIVVAPNFNGRTDYAKSSLGGEVDWDLCEKCSIKCDKREMCTMR